MPPWREPGPRTDQQGPLERKPSQVCHLAILGPVERKPSKVCSSLGHPEQELSAYSRRLRESSGLPDETTTSEGRGNDPQPTRNDRRTSRTTRGTRSRPTTIQGMKKVQSGLRTGTPSKAENVPQGETKIDEGSTGEDGAVQPSLGVKRVTPGEEESRDPGSAAEANSSRQACGLPRPPPPMPEKEGNQEGCPPFQDQLRAKLG